MKLIGLSLVFACALIMQAAEQAVPDSVPAKNVADRAKQLTTASLGR